MEKVQLAFMSFSNAIMDEMVSMKNRINQLEEDLSKTRGAQKMNRKELLEFTNVSVATLQRYLKQGLPVHGSPKKQVFFKSEVLDFLRKIGKGN